MTPLLLAVRYNQIKVVKSLVETFKASLKAVNKDGSTVLHIAASIGNRELISLLSSYQKSMLGVKNRFGRIPLHIAVEQGLCNFCIIDLANRRVVNVRDNEGTTALHLAVSGGQYEAAVILIREGALVNSRNIFGQTPLHKAASTGNIKLMKLLMSRREYDAKARDVDRKTAADIARERGFNDFAK